MPHPCSTQHHQLHRGQRLQQASVLLHSDAAGTGCEGQPPCVAMYAHTPSNKYTLKPMFHQLLKINYNPELSYQLTFIVHASWLMREPANCVAVAYC
jgi:hypothetical protein